MSTKKKTKCITTDESYDLSMSLIQAVTLFLEFVVAAFVTGVFVFTREKLGIDLPVIDIVTFIIAFNFSYSLASTLGKHTHISKSAHMLRTCVNVLGVLVLVGTFFGMM